jgi:microcystin-dependent protein
MPTPYLGEIDLFAFNFAPRGWALCNGQLLQIAQNQALFSLLGTYYGGDGVHTFALPDLRSRVALHAGINAGNTYVQGQQGGEESHTLAATEMPAHTHALNAQTPAGASNVDTPSGTTVFSQGSGANQSQVTTTYDIYVADTAPNQALAAQALSTTGGQPHANRMPFLALNYCIAMNGIFPAHN